MITEILLKLLRKDPLIKRNIIKTISWRIMGSLDTMLLSWLISGVFLIGIKIGVAEFVTKLVIYYLHERLWQRSNFGLLSKRQQARLVQKEIKPNLFKQVGKIHRHDRELLNKNKSFTLWLTGLSGSGKSTMAIEIEEWIHKNDGHIYILDGDNTRLGINNDLSFSNEDRTENIRRVAEICRLFNDAGIIVISSFISPFIKDRLMAKKIIGEENFIEVYLEASIDTCTQRDTKGLYKKAIEGKIQNFTGISSSYEPPIDSCLHLNTENTSIEECLDKIKRILSHRITLKQLEYH
jgi:adenylyl-sulfate kinase